MCRKPAQKLAIKFPIMRHTQGLASVPFFVHCNEHGELLVRVASDKLFHMLQHLLSAWGFARSLRETPLQRFHSIINDQLARTLSKRLDCDHFSWFPTKRDLAVISSTRRSSSARP